MATTKTDAGSGIAQWVNDAGTMAKVMESVVMRGDLSGLGPEARTRFYVQMCEGLGLNPASQPFAYLRLNGKEILYATRGATDQLAAMHRVNRRIVDGPKVIDLAGTKMVYAVCEASLPNGRVEQSTATLPVVDPVNMLMKCETKAKRRATLSILGLGMLDEMELETIPASAQEPGGRVDFSQVNPLHKVGIEGTSAHAPLPVEPAAFYADVEEIELPGEAVSVWVKHRGELHALTSDAREAAWKALCKRTEEVGRMKNAKVWLKKALAEHDAQQREREPGDDDDTDPTPAGGGSTSKGTGSKAHGTGASTSAQSGPTGCVEGWMTTMLGVDAYLETKAAWTPLENATRKHARTVPEGTLRMYFLRRAAERLQALSKDTLGTVLALDGRGGCRELVMTWADEGPRKAKAQAAAVETLTTASRLVA